MSDSPWQYFNTSELQCKGKDCCGGKADMHPDFMAKLVAIRRELGFPFVLSSAYRCPIHNAKESSTGTTGPHTTGRAVDILVRGTNAYKLIEAALRHGITGIGVKQKGVTRFIHIDDLEGQTRPWIWSY